MIIQIRGTSGSGKSTLARIILDSMSPCMKHLVPGRRQPLFYTGIRAGGRKVAVLGHYATACGGVDTITDRGETFRLAEIHANDGFDVIMEGVILSDEVPRTVELARKFPLTVLHMDVPLEDCLAGIRKRREAKGNEKPLNPANTQKRIPAIARACARLSASGVQVRRVDRVSGPVALEELLS